MEEYIKIIRTRELFVKISRMVMPHFLSEEFNVAEIELKVKYLNTDEPTKISIDFNKDNEEYTFDFFAVNKDTMIVKLINHTSCSLQRLVYPMDKFLETDDIFTDFFDI